MYFFRTSSLFYLKKKKKIPHILKTFPITIALGLKVILFLQKVCY